MLKYFKDTHNLHFTPAGKVHLDEKGKKAGYLKRYDNLSWTDYPNDNMGRIRLPSHLVVLDIDSAKTKLLDADDTECSIQDATKLSIPALDIVVPLGLFTQTSRVGSYHIYYQVTPEQSQEIGTSRIIKLHSLDIDILMNSVIFEWHSYSEHNMLREGDILPIPQALVESILEHFDATETHPRHSNGITVHSNIARYNLVKAFLVDDLKKAPQFNAFVRSVMPKQFLVANKRKYTWDDFKLNYTLINGVAVKLTTTKELDYHEHVIPTLYAILTNLGVNPESKKSQFILFRNILPSLPQHQSQFKYNPDEDTSTLMEHIHSQSSAQFALFRTIYNSRLMFFHVDKLTLSPVLQAGSALFDRASAQALHPERDIYNEEGQPIGWDDGVPIVEVINDPFSPQWVVDDHWRNVVNFSAPSRFVRQAEPQLTTLSNNILLRVIHSVVHPLYVELVLRYFAEVVFSDNAPVMMLWLATRASEKGGTGKSLVSLTILGKILGSQAASITDKVLNSGYSSTDGLRLLSIGEGSTSGKEHAQTYQAIKQLKNPVHSKTNVKYGAMNISVVKINITGSSNQLPRLDPNDRRYLCLEPAHVGQNPATQPLSKEDAITMAMFEISQSSEFDDVIQEFTNHLYALFLSPMDAQMRKDLYIEAPETIYRKDWVVSGVTNTKGIIFNLNDPKEFMASLHTDRPNYNLITGLLQHLIHMYNTDTQKLALSWKWFAELVPLVANDPDIDLSKSSLSKALGDIQFAHASSWFVDRQKCSPYLLGRSYAQDMYTLKIDNSAIEGYKTMLEGILNPDLD